MLPMWRFQDKVAEVEASLEGIRAEIGELEEEEGAIKRDQLEVRMQLEKFDNILKENKAKLRHWRKEVSQGLWWQQSDSHASSSSVQTRSYCYLHHCEFI